MKHCSKDKNKICFQTCSGTCLFFYPGESFGLEFNPSESELFLVIPKYVSKPIQKNLVWWKMVENQSEVSIRIIPTSDSFGFKIWFGLFRAQIALDWLGLKWNKWD